MVTIHAHALRQVLEEIKKYKKEDCLAVRVDCLVLKTAPQLTPISNKLGE
jgi:hypothetical protein